MKSKAKVDQLESEKKNTLKKSSLPNSDINTRRSRQTDSHEYHKEYSNIAQLRLDQAYAVSGSMKRTGDGIVATRTKFLKAAIFFGFGGNNTISKFLYAATNGSGHNITLKNLHHLN